MRSRSRATEKYGVTFGEASTVYIGDSTRDVEAARVGGARSVAIATGRSTEADLHTAGAGIVLPHLTDVSALIRAIPLLPLPPAAAPPPPPPLPREPRPRTAFREPRPRTA